MLKPGSKYYKPFILYVLRFCCVKKPFGYTFDQSERRNEFLTREKIDSSNHKPRFMRIVFSRAFWRSFWQDNIFGVLELFVIQTYQELGYIFEDGWISVRLYKINKLQHGKRFARDFCTRWQSIRNLTRSISDTSATRVKIPYARAFHEVISIFTSLHDSSVEA